MSNYISVKSMRDKLGSIYEAGMNVYVQKLAALGYEAIMYAYRKGHTDTPNKSYRNQPKVEYGRILVYKRGPKKGQMIMRKSPVPDGKWRHRTRNLHDSFGCAVYVAGNLIKDSIRLVGDDISRMPDPLTKKSGRQTLLDFFHSRHYGQKKGEVVLVCIAAMYYTKYLENGWHRGHYGIQVISAARDYIDRNWRSKLDVKGKAIVLKGVKPVSNERDGLL